MIFGNVIHNYDAKWVSLGFQQQTTTSITKIIVVGIADMIRVLSKSCNIFDFNVGLEVIKGEKKSKLDILKDQSDGCLCRIWQSMVWIAFKVFNLVS